MADDLVSDSSLCRDPVKSAKNLNQLAILRIVVGYLGQKNLSGWWDCNFLDATGLRFMETTFPRTAWAAAVRSMYYMWRMD